MEFNGDIMWYNWDIPLYTLIYEIIGGLLQDSGTQLCLLTL